MNLTTVLVPLPVVLPLVAAGVTLVAARRERIQRSVTIGTMLIVLAASVALLALAYQDGPQVVHAGGWPAPMGVVLAVDVLSAVMLVTSVVVTSAVLLFAIGQGRTGEEETDGESPLPIFHPTMLVLIAGVSTTFISGDLFHIYVGFEMLLLASFVLLTLGGTAERVAAGVNYVFVNLLSSLFFLAAIALIYAATGTVTLAQLATRLDALEPGTVLVLQVLLLIGFCVKAAVFPMSGWLPDSYPTAPASVTAVFAGLLTKVGVYAIIRAQTLLFPDGRLNGLLLWAAGATMIVGILGAIAQTDIKRLLSFTLVSHIGYLVFGIALGDQHALSGTIFYAVHHIVVQTTLFLVVGLVEWRRGTTELTELGGLARTSPLIAVLFFLPALNLAGIPPFSGFLGKVGIFQGAAEVGGIGAYAAMGATALTSLLTLYAVARVWSRAFWQKPITEIDPASLSPAAAGAGGDARPISAGTGETDRLAPQTGPIRLAPARLAELQAAADRPLPRGIVAPTLLLVVLGMSFTVFAGGLFDITDRAAAELVHRDGYIAAVFPGGTP